MTDAALWHYRARCIRVIDGDTVVVLVDTGFGSRHEVTLRVAGIDAPEIDTPEGLAAADALARIVARGGGGEWPLRVRTSRLRSGREAMSFSRYVGSLAVVGEGDAAVDVASAMVAGGNAEAR